MDKDVKEKDEELWSLKNDNLSFYRRHEPYGDFCLVYGYPCHGLQIVGNDTGLFYHTFSFSDEYKPCSILSSQPLAQTKSCNLFFAGIGRSMDKLLLGQSDAAELSDPRQLRDSIGNFVMVYQDEKELYIGSDYFGTGKLFYYSPKGAKGIVISNRYHLLLMTLKAMGETLSLNKDKCLADLYRIGQPAQQIFSRDMEVNDTYLLPVDRCFVITSDGCRETPTEIDEVLRNPGQLDMSEYPKLLKQAAEEIVDNIRIVYQTPKIKRVSIDVTGGLDSRVVLTAWTNLSTEMRKSKPTRMWTSPSAAERKISLLLGHSTGLKLETYKTEVSRLFCEQEYLKATSSYFGEYLIYGGASNKRCVDGLLNLTGAFGEICCRPYYSREMMYRGKGQYETIEQMVNVIALDGARVQRISTPVLCAAWKKEIYQELKLLPGKTYLEKWDLHYLYYRNRIHFPKEFIAEYGVTNWGAAMSKTSFKLKMLTFHTFPELKLQTDLIALLNPVVASFPYYGAKDEDARRSLVEKRQAAEQSYVSYENNYDVDDDKIFSAYTEEARRQTRYLPSKYANSFYVESNKEFENHRLLKFNESLLKTFTALGDRLSDRTKGDILGWIYGDLFGGERLKRQREFFINRIIYLSYLLQYVS